jgi:hypothetical protein
LFIHPLETTDRGSTIFCIDDNNFIGRDTVFNDSGLLRCDAVTGKAVPSNLKNISPSTSRVDSHSTTASQPEYQNPQSPHCENFKTGTQFSVTDFIFTFIFFLSQALQKYR